MPAYHSSIPVTKSIANVALMPLRTKHKGPGPRLQDGKEDVIDEALYFYRANIFFRNYDIKNDADRTLIYVTLYLQQCLKKLLQKGTTKEDGKKALYALAVTPFDIPGDPGFPLNAMYAKPQTRPEADQIKAYFQQIRNEAGERLLDKVYDPSTNKLNKWWICYAKRRFMDKSLSAPGQ